jgi:hypothetical protein
MQAMIQHSHCIGTILRAGEIPVNTLDSQSHATTPLFNNTIMGLKIENTLSLIEIRRMDPLGRL